jgi:glucokinase
MNELITIGVDLGGTKIEAGLVDQAGTIIVSSRRTTGARRGAEGVVDDIAACIRDCFPSNALPHAIGVGVAGQVDRASGTVWYAPNLGWKNFPFRVRLEEAVKLPVFVLNDVQAATFAEWRHGEGKGIANMVTIFVGTGVGGGVVLDGRLIHGCDGSAGELGHLKIDRDGRRCSCDRRGCLEAYAGGWAIARRAKEIAATEPRRAQVLIALANGDLEAITARTGADAYREEDPLAQQLVEEVARALGAGLASVANAFNPCLIVLGGGVIDGIPQLVDLAGREMEARVLDVARKSLRISTPALGKHAGTVGAAAWAHEALGAG